MMPEIAVYNMEKEEVGKVDFPAAFEERASYGLLHQTILAQQANRRQGNAKVKTRHEVAGSTRKIYRQKGTGGARHGDIKAPLFVGGGQAFGPKPKDYDIRLPQKMRRGALISAVHQRKGEGRLWVLDGLEFKEPKTAKAAALFLRFGIENALVVLEEAKVATEKSIRNLPRIKVCRIDALNVLDVIRYDHLVLTKNAYEKLVGRLS